MKTSSVGIALICHFEGCKLTAYKCPAGIWTVGYGHTGAGVTSGLTITQDRAEQLLAADLLNFETGVYGMTGSILQCRFDALVSFSYNLGLHTLEGSTLLRKFRLGDIAGASAEFPRWCHVGGAGVVLEGLVRRRAAERVLFDAGDWMSAVQPIQPKLAA